MENSVGELVQRREISGGKSGVEIEVGFVEK